MKSCVSFRIDEDCEAASPSLGSGGTRVWSRPGGPKLDSVQGDLRVDEGVQRSNVML